MSETTFFRLLHHDDKAAALRAAVAALNPLEDWLDQVVPRLGERRVLLCLDEFEKLGSAMHACTIPLTVLDELRHLIQHHDELGFLFCGVQTLDELGPNWSSYFISVRPIEMTYLEPDEAHDLLTNPDPVFNLGYAEGIVERVLHETRCQPYLLQLMGEAMVTQVNQHLTQGVTDELLEAAFAAALRTGEPYFTNLWTEYTGTTPNEVRAGQAVTLSIILPFWQKYAFILERFSAHCKAMLPRPVF